MKTTFFLISIYMFCACTSSDKDSVKVAQMQNQNAAIDEDISTFLTEAADARMMDLEQGKLAAERGTTPAIKQYGELMIKDQTKLLHQIRMLAASKNITLPNTLSNKKADGLEDLKEETGEDFDRKFVKMMTLDHKRDVRDFEDAQDYKDKDVKQFATTNLPLIESHLEKIRSIKESEGSSGISERKEEQD